jgi:hypothetical protein
VLQLSSGPRRVFPFAAAPALRGRHSGAICDEGIEKRKERSTNVNYVEARQITVQEAKSNFITFTWHCNCFAIAITSQLLRNCCTITVIVETNFCAFALQSL